MKKLFVSLFLSLFVGAALQAQSVTVSPSTTNFASTGGSVTFTVQLTYPGTLSGLSFTMGSVPSNWTFASVGGTNPPNTVPNVGATGNYFFAYTAIPATSAPSFTFTLNYPAGMTTTQTFSSLSMTHTPTGGSGSTVGTGNVVLSPPVVAPTITVQPANLSVTQGTGAVFGVIATGSPTPSYQWQKNGFDISGATNSTYSITSANTFDAGTFSVIVSNAGGSVASSAATLTVNVTPTISSQPQAASVNQGQVATFSVGATGTPAPNYQWRRNGANVSGGTNSILTLNNVTAADAGNYDVVVSNAGGSVTSSAVALTVVTPPSISSAPASTAANAGGNVSFSVTAGGTAPFTYQWRKNGQSITGQTNATLSLTSVTTADGAAYDVVVTNAAGRTVSPFATLTINSAPGIITQPLGVQTTSGTTATFTAVATGTGAISFQWRKNGTPITNPNNAVLLFNGVSTAILTLNSVGSGDAASYDVIVSNSFGSVTSNTASLSLVTAPSITVQPVAQTLTVGGNATFSVSATGSGNLTYQWRKNGLTVAGATASTYSLVNVSTNDVASYDVLVANTVSSVTSNAVALTVNSLPVISSHPFPVTTTQGQAVTFSVVASGTPTPTYQWRKNGVNAGAASATSSTLSLSNVTGSDIGRYDVVVTNSVGSIVSSTAALGVNVAPTITNQPGSYTITTGQSGQVFGVGVSGTAPITYQWRFNGSPLTTNPTSGQPTLQIFNAQTTDGGSYDVVVTNPYGSVTTSARTLTVVSVTTSPSVTTQPISQSASEGTSVSLSVIASGNPSPTFQWRKNGANLTDGTQASGAVVSGATAASMFLGSLTASEAASYDCVVTNSNGSATSSSATLTITKVPTITTHPTGGTVTAGGNITLTAVVAGNPTSNYQWFKDSVVVSGATGASLTLSSITAAQAGNYTMVAVNSFGSATSTVAQVVVNATPVITLQPVPSVNIGQNQTLNLTVVATGVPTPTFQWRKGGSNVSGAVSSTFTIGGVQSTDTGTYDVVVTNSIGSVTSSSTTVNVIVAPSITAQPSGGTFNQGQSTTLTLTATGTAPLAYQWFKDGKSITGAISASYALSSLVADSAGVYYCTVSNPAGSATTASAGINVNASPSITSQPQSQTATVGAAASFSVTAAGSPPISFQWNKNGVNIDNATGGSYTIGSVQKTDAGIYRVTVFNSLGTVTSNFVSLAVNDIPQVAPTITTQPAAYSGTAGTGATLSVVAEGTATLTYQWRKDGTAISGATNSSHALTGTVAESGSYTVVISNVAGNVTSSAAVVTIRPAIPLPVIVVQPSSRTLQAGGSTSLSVQATGQGPLTYQWRKDGTAISGATSTELSLANVTEANGGVYSVTVTNEGGTTTSSNATVTVSAADAAPKIVSQPTPQVAMVGGSAAFAVVATGNPAPAYQWRKNGTNIAGATTATLSLSNVQNADAAGYDVVLLNSSGQVISALARLTVSATSQAPVITRQPASTRLVAGRSASFYVVANGTPAPTYQWRLNGNAISGATNATLAIVSATSAQAGAYSVVVTNSAGSVTSNNADLAVLGRSYAGTWHGTLGGSGGSFALRVGEDNTGVFLGYVGSTRTSYVSRSVRINDDGTFSIVVSTTTGVAASVNPDAPEGTLAAGVDDLTFGGNIAADGPLTGASTSGSTLALSAARANDAGVSSAVAGFYQAAASGSSAQTLVIVGPAGQAFVLVQSGASVDGGAGTVDATGRLAVSTAGSQTIVATVAADTGAVSVTAVDSKNVTTSFSGFASGSSALGEQRLSNISTRASAGIGAESVIVGFVVTGLESKTVLIRAVGPTLRTLGVATAAAAPRLDLSRGTTLLATNIGWTSAGSPTADIIAAAARAGAFPLGATSADSVILATLPPGNYSATCSAADARTGVALVEVYDLSGGSTAQKLANISTRALTGPGENVLTAGVVVTGSAPKRVLIRAVGPTLAQFGLTGVLARPQLTLINSAGATVATNAGWSTSADAGAITEAAARSGAFTFPSASLDAALILNLAPGNYTAQVSGVGATSGIALVEVYELP
jgi:hypothetical protein